MSNEIQISLRMGVARRGKQWAVTSSQSAVEAHVQIQATQCKSNIYASLWLTAEGGSGCRRQGAHTLRRLSLSMWCVFNDGPDSVQFSCNRRLPKPLMTYHFSDMPPAPSHPHPCAAYPVTRSRASCTELWAIMSINPRPQKLQIGLDGIMSG